MSPRYVELTENDYNKILKEEERFASKNRYDGRKAYVGKWVDFPQDVELDDEKKYMLISLLHNEGNWTAVNMWDNQGFTFGPGFSSKGQLNVLWANLKAIARERLKILTGEDKIALAGAISIWFSFGIKEADDGTISFQRGNLKGNNAYRSLSRHKEDLKHFVHTFEDNPVVMDVLQRAIIKSFDLTIPDFAKDWPLCSKIVGIHLAHWVTGKSWLKNPNDFTATQGDVVNMIRLQYSILDKNYQYVITPEDQKGRRPSERVGLIKEKIGYNKITRWIGGDKIWELLRRAAREVPANEVSNMQGFLAFWDPDLNAYLCIRKSTPTSAATPQRFSIQNSPDKNHVIYDAVNSLNEYFKTNDMRSRYTLLASYLVTPNVDSHKFAAHLFSNMLNGALEACGLPLKSRFKTVFAQNMQIDMDTNQGLIGISGPILKARNTVWILQTSSGTDDFNQTAWWIDIIVGDTTYTFPVIASDADGHPYNPVVEAYKSFLYLILEKAYDNLIITRDDIRKSGVKL